MDNFFIWKLNAADIIVELPWRMFSWRRNLVIFLSCGMCEGYSFEAEPSRRYSIRIFHVENMTGTMDSGKIHGCMKIALSRSP